MNIKTARFLDCFVGVPLCYILSLWHSLQKGRGKAGKTFAQPKKIIFIELSEIGSAVLSYSAIKKIKEGYPDSQLYFWIFKDNQDGVRLLNLIEDKNIITLRHNNLFVLALDMLRNLLQIRRERIDAAIDLELFSRFSSILGYLAGAKIRLGFYSGQNGSIYRGHLHTRGVTYNSQEHIAQNFLNLAERLFGSNIEKRNLVLPKVKSNKNIENKLNENSALYDPNSKLILVHPSVNDKISLRRWPMANYRALIQRILSKNDFFVVLVGTGSGLNARSLMVGPRCINLIGKTTTEEIMALLNRASILISSDSGIVHLASLTNVRIIALFGPETPALYSPLSNNAAIIYRKISCSPCLTAYNYRSSRCRKNECMQLISVDEVYGQVLGALK